MEHGMLGQNGTVGQNGTGQIGTILPPKVFHFALMPWSILPQAQSAYENFIEVFNRFKEKEVNSLRLSGVY